MHSIDRLCSLSITDLRKELCARAEGRAPSLPEISDELVLRTLRSFQIALYGRDDRRDLFELRAHQDVADADSVVALFAADMIVDNGNGTSTLQTVPLGRSKNLCRTERFWEQPSGADGTGFLVAPGIIATAGHCARSDDVSNMRFVFGYRMRDASTNETLISNDEIYGAAEVIERRETESGSDWALLRLDREVRNHRIARVRRAGKIADGQRVHVIGHPLGLPLKFAGDAVVRSNHAAAFFVANLDTYGGNSGSPVFNSDSHEVEGILVRGERDFVRQGSCNISLECPTTGCRGEDCTRTTEFAGVLESLM